MPPKKLSKYCIWEGCTEETWHRQSPYCHNHRIEAKKRYHREGDRRRRQKIRQAEGRPDPACIEICVWCKVRPTTGHSSLSKTCEQCRRAYRNERRRLDYLATQEAYKGNVETVLKHVRIGIDRILVGTDPATCKRLEGLARILLSIKFDYRAKRNAA